MGKAPSRESEPTAPASNRSTPILLVASIADTTWRMFVPSVGFTLLGVWADNQWNTKPWLMILGIAVGTAGAYLLVSRQITKLKDSDN